MQATAIEADFINRMMQRSRSRRQVVILDCCYSGAFARGMMAKADRTIITGESFKGRGKVVLTASDAMQYAFEGDAVEGEGVSSIFTKYLIQGLETGEADANNDGDITLQELYDYVYEQVKRELPQQSPQKWDFGLEGKICIACNPNPVIKPAELPSELMVSLTDMRPWVREGAARTLKELLYGSGKPMALAAHEALKRMEEDDSYKVRSLVGKILGEFAAQQPPEIMPTPKAPVVEAEIPPSEKLAAGTEGVAAQEVKGEPPTETKPEEVEKEPPPPPPPPPKPSRVETPPPAGPAVTEPQPEVPVEEYRSVDKVPAKAWRTVFSGFAIYLTLGILYAWSVWKRSLVVPLGADGRPDLGLVGLYQTADYAQGWKYIDNDMAATPFSFCIILFALLMIPGGRIQDRFGPKVGAITGGLCLALGCIIAGVSKSYAGLLLGFGILGGIGLGIAYAAPMPAALKWFGPHQRGLVAGLVVSGYGLAALYIAPLARMLINTTGLTGSFVVLGLLFGLVIIIAGSWLAWPEPGYVPPTAPVTAGAAAKAATAVDWNPSESVRTWQLYALIFLFICTTMSGLLLIANAATILKKAAASSSFLLANAWILASYGGLVNAAGRIGTGKYSDILGRDNAYTLNCLVSAACLFFLPWIISSESIFLLFVAACIGFWVYGGGLALLPAYTADFYGTKNLGLIYGIVFLGWGLGFWITKLGGWIEDATGSLNWAFWFAAVILLIGVGLSRMTKRPVHSTE